METVFVIERSNERICQYRCTADVALKWHVALDEYTAIFGTEDMAKSFMERNPPKDDSYVHRIVPVEYEYIPEQYIFRLPG